MTARLKHLTEERLSELLRALPPAPASWVASAMQLPRRARAMPEARTPTPAPPVRRATQDRDHHA
jgi:hypothetical protein